MKPGSRVELDQNKDMAQSLLHNLSKNFKYITWFESMLNFSHRCKTFSISAGENKIDIMKDVSFVQLPDQAG